MRDAKRKMASNKAATLPTAPMEDPAMLQIDNRYVREGDTDERAVVARTMSQPDVRAASVIQMLDGSLVDINYLAAEMRVQIADAHSGGMVRAEAMLIAQAHTLDALFCNLSRRAIGSMDEGHVEISEQYMKLALRAQSQCRSTLEALSAIKNPPVVYAKQANIAHGPQQVNNGVPTGGEPHTGKNNNPPNELGESARELLQNTSTQSLAGPAMPGAEALVKIHRTEN